MSVSGGVSKAAGGHLVDIAVCLVGLLWVHSLCLGAAQPRGPAGSSSERARRWLEARGCSFSHARGVCTPQEWPSCHPRMASELSSAIQRSHYLEKENWSYTLGVLPLTSDSLLASDVTLRAGIFSNSNYLRTLLELAYTCRFAVRQTLANPVLCVLGVLTGLL